MLRGVATVPARIGADEVRGIPLADKRLLADIAAQLDGIKEHSVAAVIQVPDGRVLRGALFVNVGKGLSFATWIDRDLGYKPELGWGVAVRKSW